MSTRLYALRMESRQLVAAEVSDSTAARLIDGGQTVFLGTQSELIALARRQRKSVTILARQTGPGRNAASGRRAPFARPVVAVPSVALAGVG